MVWTCLVANLQMKVTWFWMEAEVNSVSIVTNNVFGPRILTVASPYQLLQSTNKHMDTLASMKPKMIKKKKFSFTYYT